MVFGDVAQPVDEVVAAFFGKRENLQKDFLINSV
jgi:hypothetical protein